MKPSLKRLVAVRPLVLILGLVGAALFGAALTSWAQPPEAERAETSAGPAEASEPQSPLVVPPPTVQSTEQAAPESALGRALDRLDLMFERAVEGLETVLFARIGARERYYVQFAEQNYYVRPDGGEETFLRLTPTGVDANDQLDAAEIQRLEALGQLILGPTGQAIREGEVEGREVEFVAVKIDAPRYVLKEAQYRRVLPLRDQLSETDVLSSREVRAAAAQGRLQLDPDKLAAGDPTPYLLVEKGVGGAPLVVLWLSLGAVVFTIYMRGFNLWGFWHAVQVVRGRFDDPDEPGEVTHFQALSSALSATVGLGNIAGVTIAMTLGGPGAFFWMMACGVFGMTSKFVECTLGVKYREVKPDGTVLGGPMQYLYLGLKERGLGALGLVLSIAFAVMCVLASFGGGNMFQANQAGQQVLAVIQLDSYDRIEAINEEMRQAAEAGNDARIVELQREKQEIQTHIDSFARVFLPIFGLVLAGFVAVVIIGGIKRIGAAASRIVPTMCLIYIAACLWIILKHLPDVPGMLALIFREAFSPEAFGGGLVGVMVIGIQRAAFSNEAGVGSAAIAHSAARTDEPIREGTVALMEPFIDTVVVCSMTALVILITGAWNNHEWIVEQGRVGATLTSKAFKQEISFFPYVLSIAVVLFAYSTMISWSYYGERSWERLFGSRSTIAYKVIYVTAVFVGTVVNLGSVLTFSDMMILSMAFPNVLGLLILAPSVRRDLLDYWRRYQSGQFATDERKAAQHRAERQKKDKK